MVSDDEYRRFVGKTITVRTTRPVAGKTAQYTGRVLEVTQQFLILDDKLGDRVNIKKDTITEIIEVKGNGL